VTVLDRCDEADQSLEEQTTRTATRRHPQGWRAIRPASRVDHL